METADLRSETRAEAGTSAARKLRAIGRIPAVLYGDREAVSLTVDAKEFEALTHSKAGSHVIVRLSIEGLRGHPTAVIKEIQRDPVRDSILHVDFHRIALDERIRTTVPIAVVGEPAGAKQGGVLQHHLWEVTVEALPKDLPEHVELDVSSLEIGDALHASDLSLGEGVVIQEDPGELLVSVLPPAIEKVPVAEEEVEEVVEGAPPAGEKAEETAAE